MKRTVAILLIALMMVGLIGCTAAPEAAKPEAEAPAVAENAASAETAEAPEEVGFVQDVNDPYAQEYTADGEPIKVGAFYSLTGSSAMPGTVCYNSAQMTVDYINAHGGVNGRPIELIVYDDATTPEGAVKAATRLIEEDEVSLIMGCHISPNIAAAMPYCEEAGVPMIAIGTGLSWTNIGNRYTYRATLNGFHIAPAIVESISEMGEKNVALFIVETDLGQSYHKYLVEDGALADAGLNLVADISYQKGESDFTGHITKALATNPDAVIIFPGGGPETAQFMKQLRQQGYTGLLYTNESGSSNIIRETCGEYADGLVFAGCAINTATIEESLTDLTKHAQQMYLDTYGEMAPNDGVFRGYDQALISAHVLRTAADPEDAESVTEAILAVSGVELSQGVFDYTAGTGDALERLNRFMVMDGELKLYDAEQLKAFKAGN